MTKKEAFKSIMFCVLFMAILISLSYALRTNGDVKDRFTGFYSEPDNTIDVIYIGSSPVPDAFATPKIWGETGITSYPLSSNVQRPAAAKYLVEEALKTQSPSLFVFEVSMYAMPDADMMANMAYTRGVTDNLKYSLNRIRLINALVPTPEEQEALINARDDFLTDTTGQAAPAEESTPLDTADMNRLYYYFDIFKYHSNWKTLALWSQLRTCFYEYPDDLKGYLPEAEIGEATRFDTKDYSAFAPIPPEQEAVLLDLLAYLDEHDIPALFVLVPEAIPTDKAARYNTIKKIVTENGHDFLDMNEYYDEMGFDFTRDFKDSGGHLNSYGANKVSAFFEEYLLTHYTFTDKRGDSAYASWDEAYELWKSTFSAMDSGFIQN